MKEHILDLAYGYGRQALSLASKEASYKELQLMVYSRKL